MNRDAINQVLERCGAVMHPANKRALEQALRGAGPSQRHTVKAAQARTLVFGDLSGPEPEWAKGTVGITSGRQPRRDDRSIQFGDIDDTAPRRAHCDGCQYNVMHKSGIRVCRKACGCSGNMKSNQPPVTIQIETIVSSSFLGCRLGHF